MKIVTGYPENYEEIKAAFPAIENMATVFAYGDTLYNPTGAKIPDHLLVHEQTHTKQQAMSPDLWWRQYIADAQFRLQQEVEAYGNQYAYISEIASNRVRREFLHTFSKTLSSEMYGSIVSYAEADRLIRTYAKGLTKET